MGTKFHRGFVVIPTDFFGSNTCGVGYGFLSVKTYLFLGSVLSFLTEAQNTLPKFASSPGRIFLVAKTKIASGS
ncbi:hypothetical protein LEP1GSC036_0476 [Leptospira weilii str. 2006001853]|uniref:Uncharacterized protein n=1 Tax=Leptospira weilii str. 2006001853 TaxID=1001589 RepID=A0A828Z269_9LEPT|nr:hypothetical protein [Leptospira weilii]EKR65098.1 hypothetical protein LEP1GSC036_0476 [Leptospira weilii str. 2006001853]EMN44824.1 hypothetical protein LEP1GSC086_0669 [Leptospira weilii str. LNT 1234]QDK26011.1 hypothetical protein FHG68_04290 [Leptospira weilii]